MVSPPIWILHSNQHCLHDNQQTGKTRKEQQADFHPDRGAVIDTHVFILTLPEKG